MRSILCPADSADTLDDRVETALALVAKTFARCAAVVAATAFRLVREAATVTTKATFTRTAKAAPLRTTVAVAAARTTARKFWTTESSGKLSWREATKGGVAHGRLAEASLVHWEATVLKGIGYRHIACRLYF